MPLGQLDFLPERASYDLAGGVAGEIAQGLKISAVMSTRGAVLLFSAQCVVSLPSVSLWTSLRGETVTMSHLFSGGVARLAH
jgi:hypothetical protein